MFRRLLAASVLFLGFATSANALTVTNTTVRAVTDTAYPALLFYIVFGIGVFCLALDILFFVMKAIPPSAMIITSVIGFSLFMIAAYMAPLVADITVVSTEAETSVVSNYIFSPFVTYICMGLYAICFVLIWLGVVRYYQMLAANQKYLNNPDRQFEMYMRGEND